MIPGQEEHRAGEGSSGRDRRERNLGHGQGMAMVDIEPWGLFEDLWGRLDEHVAEAPEPAEAQPEQVPRADFRSV